MGARSGSGPDTIPAQSEPQTAPHTLSLSDLWGRLLATTAGGRRVAAAEESVSTTGKKSGMREIQKMGARSGQAQDQTPSRQKQHSLSHRQRHTLSPCLTCGAAFWLLLQGKGFVRGGRVRRGGLGDPDPCLPGPVDEPWTFVACLPGPAHEDGCPVVQETTWSWSMDISLLLETSA
ncbi:hypothetical protein ACOMHN_062582 [Nucella lapillus]